MENRFFISDTHFHHKNIVIIGEGRPFADVDEMNEAIVERWNERVRKQDMVYHLGDFSFGSKEKTIETLSRLRGQIHIVRGNHDHVLDSVVKTDVGRKKIQSYQHYKEIKVGGQRLVLFHFPILSFHQAHKGAWHLHGHCHGNLDPAVQRGPMVDVGVDVWNYAPVAYDEIKSYMEQRPPWNPVDHHARSAIL